MRKYLKNLIKHIIPVDTRIKTRLIAALYKNFIADLVNYRKHSMLLSLDSFNKYEAKIIIEYHRIEKGLLFEEFKAGFGQKSIETLINYLQLDIVKNNDKSNQIFAAEVALKTYFEKHKHINYDISDFFPLSFYNELCNRLNSKEVFDSIEIITYQSFYENINNKFDEFSYSRKSIRHFSENKVPLNQIKNAVKLASNSPSVCNRQASKVYLIEDKQLIDSILKIQNGFNGYINDVKQLLILTNNRNSYFSVGERNQLFIDGGIFLMNLLYALHFYNIANCPANWSKEIDHENELNKFISIPSSEKIICMIPIGIAKENIRITKSLRRNIDEILIKI